MKFASLLSVLLLALSGCGGGGGASNGGSGGSGGGNDPFGLDARVTASGIQIPTTPPSGGSDQVNPVDAFPNVRIPGPTYLTGANDGTNRLFVTDRNGVIWTFANNVGSAPATVLLDLSSRVDDSAGENGMLGLVFDPQFSSNGYFYVSYVYVPNPASPDPNARTVRLSRFSVTTLGGNVANASSERVILEYAHRENYHFGGWIGFGPEGNRTLYMSAGDGGNQREAQETNNFFGKVLRIRINTDGSYAVPSDNPYGNEIWARGFRNPWRCSFDRGGNHELWCGDVGESDYEEIDLVKKGANYGWPFFEGPQAFVDPGTRQYSEFEPAVHYYAHSVGVAVIGGFVYRGSAVPGLQGRYLYSDFATPNLWALRTDGSANTVASTALSDIRSFGEDDAGELYAVSGQTGIVYRFEAAGGGGTPGPTMPATLSATGLFTNTAALTPAPSLIDYTLNSPLWSDGAAKRRWFVLPGNQTIDFDADGAWSFPVGTITVKHFELPLAAGGTTRLETRVMVHRTDGWVGFTYRWRTDQQDADLLVNGATATYNTINPATNTPVALTWTFPSQAQCLNCHTLATGRVLGLNTRQFNRSHNYAATGRSDNQLRTLNHIGVFGGDIGAASQYGAMPDPKDASAALEARAKAYLDSNCSICHRPGGPTPVTMDLRYATSRADMNILGVATSQSGGGVRVVPGNHAASDLWQRVSSSGANRMPPLAVSLVDEEAARLLADWIDSTP